MKIKKKIHRRRISIKKIILLNILLFNIYIILNDIYRLIIGYRYNLYGILTTIIIINIIIKISNYFYKEIYNK